MGSRIDRSGSAPVIIMASADGESRGSIASLLATELGARVLLASSAHEVLDLLGLVERPRGGRDTTRITSVDLIVAQLDLPDLEALGLCQRVRQATRLRDLPVLVLGARGEDAFLAEVFEAGVSDFLRLPVGPRELVARARAALRTSQAKLRADERARRFAALVRRLQRANQELESLVCVDALTGLANRRHIEAVYHGAWQQAARSGRGMAALLVDIDGFHAYNERHGHLSGDACLKRVAKELAQCLRRPGDLAGRWGGEEFVGLLPETDSEGARVVGERLCAGVECLQIPHGAPGWGPVVTISVGYAAGLPAVDQDPELLLAAADAALYRAKAEGRNRVCGDADEGSPRAPAGVAPPVHGMPEAVVVDPSLAERLSAMIAARVEDLRAVDRAIEAHDFDRLRFVARELRTLAARHGFATSELAMRLESAATARAVAEARSIAGDLRWYLEHVPVVYRRSTGKVVRS